MVSKEYEKKSKSLQEATKIAIEIFKIYPPKGFTPQHLDIVLQSLSRVMENLITPDPKFANMGSLKYVIQEVFTYFNEATGETVDEFWKKIKMDKLPFERENRLEKILAKGKIKNSQEYDYVIDTMVPFKHEGIISELDFQLLNKLAGEFENKKLKRK